MGSGFGPPKKVLVDNGGEFNNDEFMEAMCAFDVFICATGAESPWSNGMCERNHAVVDEMLHKIVDDNPELTVSVALSYACSE